MQRIRNFGPGTLRSTFAWLALLAALIFAGCSSDSPDPARLEGSSLEFADSPQGRDGLPFDRELKTLIENHSEGVGLGYFMLPNDGDFAAIPQDPKNKIKGFNVTIGMYLFQETGLAVDNVRPEGFETYSCGSCHAVQASFFPNRAQGLGEGGMGFGTAGEGRSPNPDYDYSPDQPDITSIRPPTVANIAYSEVVMWDGKLGGVGRNIGTEAQWTPASGLDVNYLGMHGPETQALAGLSVHRMGSISHSQVKTNVEYQTFFLFAYGDTEINRNRCAKSIAQFERTVLTNQAPFQKWLRGQQKAMTKREIRGAKLFFGKANCVACHTGPALNSMKFRALGMNDIDGSWDGGNVDLTAFGGTIPDGVRKGRGGFTQNPADDYKFKTPQLYNLKASPYYGHGASFKTIREVVEYINDAVPQNPLVPPSQLAPEFKPLNLTEQEIDDLTAFIEDGLYDPSMMRYRADHLPTALCYPAADPLSKIDLGCNAPEALSLAPPLDLRRPVAGLGN